MSVEPVTSPFTAVTGTSRHAALRALAAIAPVQRVRLFTGLSAWLVTGYAEARAVLTHPDVAKHLTPSYDALPADVAAAMSRHLLGTNPPDHTRLRRLVAAAFTTRRTDALAPRIQAITDGLLDELAARGPGPVDLVATFAHPLAITVIAEILGIPEHGRSDFGHRCGVLMTAAAQPRDTFVDAATAIVAQIRELIAAKRAHPGDDVLSTMIAARDGTDRLTEDELTSMAFLLLSAGHETTVALLAGGVHALLSHPDQLALLRAEPRRLPAAVDELLRYDGPALAAMPSVATAPITIGGETIAPGDLIVVSLVAANRDPGRFSEPDRLDITREQAPHLGFGHGIHHCIGAPLARLEARIGIGSLLARYPRLRLAAPHTEPERNPALILNTLVALDVLVH
ncbi:cytochrome P450 family protein [Pseudonocardia sp. GCM10023141]|uniref:cytochrome P450 family protein n=1 Tax=Pseudonocardia sp. GCM10023141 TaxID=3252653 RepID=UPI00361647BB